FCRSNERPRRQGHAGPPPRGRRRDRARPAGGRHGKEPTDPGAPPCPAPPTTGPSTAALNPLLPPGPGRETRETVHVPDGGQVGRRGLRADVSAAARGERGGPGIDRPARAGHRTRGYVPDPDGERDQPAV